MSTAIFILHFYSTFVQITHSYDVRLILYFGKNDFAFQHQTNTAHECIMITKTFKRTYSRFTISYKFVSLYISSSMNGFYVVFIRRIMQVDRQREIQTMITWNT